MRQSMEINLKRKEKANADSGVKQKTVSNGGTKLDSRLHSNKEIIFQKQEKK